ncbi:ABC transporter ATP-binding protein [Exiguobacterium sp. SL-9]|uniref:ABC transporter ATP-binding protein n=1 Tax=Exiguobacterium sp. SL-9 TaxID=2510963 RepID=UPI00103E12D5|nr:ABC transporter ATP-binding protein [Exiguobacterium sp. SL-9]TCI20508.1 ABC transporter ATP-binding protein [Exiguobacterium sp. SL-9]
MNTFDLQQVVIGYDQKMVLEDLTFSIPHGKITVLLGANGCGKSTLLSTLARQRDVLGGTIAFRDKPLDAYRAKEAARLMAFMPQVNVAPDGLTVEQLVRFGRYPYQTFFKRYSEDDERAVERALAFTDTVSLRDTLVSNLSGGQKQRVWIALALAQESETILLDEPTTYLDMSHQIEILDLMYRLNRLEGKTIIMVLHDLHLACRYADHIIALAGGNVYRQGSPNDVVDEDFMQDVFGLKVVVTEDPLYGTPLCIPYSHYELNEKRPPTT